MRGFREVREVERKFEDSARRDATSMTSEELKELDEKYRITTKMFMDKFFPYDRGQ